MKYGHVVEPVGPDIESGDDGPLREEVADGMFGRVSGEELWRCEELPEDDPLSPPASSGHPVDSKDPLVRCTLWATSATEIW